MPSYEDSVKRGNETRARYGKSARNERDKLGKEGRSVNITALSTSPGVDPFSSWRPRCREFHPPSISRRCNRDDRGRCTSRIVSKRLLLRGGGRTRNRSELRIDQPGTRRRFHPPVCTRRVPVSRRRTHPQWRHTSHCSG